MDNYSDFICLPRSDAPRGQAAAAWRPIIAPANLTIAPVQCEKKWCPTPNISHGRVECTGLRYQDTCVLICNILEFFVLAQGDGKYTCEDSRRFVGNGTCVPARCPRPRLVPNAISSNCPEQMEEGETCKVKCEQGYSPFGEYKCLMQRVVAKPVCAVGGTDFERNLYVDSTLVVSLANATFNGTLNRTSLTLDKSFRESVRAGVTVGLEGATFTSVRIQDVVSVLTPAQRLGLAPLAPSRRLRRLSGHGSNVTVTEPQVVLEISVWVRVMSEVMGTMIIARLSGSQKTRFEEVMLKFLRDRYTDLSVLSLVLMHPRLLSRYEQLKPAFEIPEKTGLGPEVIIFIVFVSIGGAAFLTWACTVYTMKQCKKQRRSDVAFDDIPGTA